VETLLPEELLKCVVDLAEAVAGLLAEGAQQRWMESKATAFDERPHSH
jgi:hypothetical protein